MDDTPPFEIDRKDVIDGLGKGLRVIEAFDDDHVRMTASEMGVRAGITRTAARRYLLSLVHFGFMATDGKFFWLTPRVLRLGQSYLNASRLPRLVQPFIQRVSMQCGETVNVSVLDGHEVIYVARSNSPRLVSIGHHVGARAPAHVVTPGTAMLSTWSDEALKAWAAVHEFSSYTGQTVTDPQRFLDNCRTARALGYWITERQLDMNLVGIAVPLLNRKGECKAAMSCTVQAVTHTTEDLAVRLLPLLREAALGLAPLI
ncbi:MAG TPA: IclR family transcriptional regulator C-terminal domain-containing protein [Ideonella sp.]|uniref:IclR family transcriptional regulator domain-containing protein n=1 Tax=Ideonella sp. TaxID=1929293 RepID=UPI002CC187DE|nr:IclR family transcriptional regulator C-terminal domain-containing protein [Ideonella sp.]HSI48609.1 IclR family transcriptional regulator C-terminal domain-containing protein [Ideonella sp.]